MTNLVPPADLAQRLHGLELVDAAAWTSAARWVARLPAPAAGLDTVWLDALVQSRRLTPTQAQWLREGWDGRLRIGPWIVERALRDPAYAACFAARHSTTGQRRRLLWMAEADDQFAADVGHLAARHAEIRPQIEAAWPREPAPLLWIEQSGRHAGGLWMATPLPRGGRLAQQLALRGRFPPDAAYEVLRQTVGLLALLEAANLLHGDVRADLIWLDPSGVVVLAEPGLRPLVCCRPTPGRTTMALAMYDNLAPEQAGDGRGTSTASELYACGLLAWHLLTGTPALVGATAADRRRSARVPELGSILHRAAGTPPELARCVMECLAANPTDRPGSLEALSQRLGSSTFRGRRRVARRQTEPMPMALRLERTARRLRRSAQAPVWAASVAGCLALLGLVPIMRSEPASTEIAPVGAFAAVAEPLPPIAYGEGPLPIRADPQVLPAVYEAPRQPPRSPIPDLAVPSPTARLRQLPGGTFDGNIDWSFQNGQVIRGSPAGRRTRVLVPAGGLIVDAEGVRFERIDFEFDRSAVSAHAPAVLLRVLADEVSLADCTFSAGSAEWAPDTDPPPVAIDWTGAEVPFDRIDLLPTARIELVRCVFRGAARVLRLPLGRAVIGRCEQVLVEHCGRAVVLSRAPADNEPVRLVFRHCTLREVGYWFDIDDQVGLHERGPIELTASACAMQLAPGGALVRITAARSPADLLAALTLDGPGTLLAGPVPLVTWRADDGQQRAAADAAVRHHGFQRLEFGFAGFAGTGNPVDSTVVLAPSLRWTGDPPGIDASQLPH